MKQNKHNFKSTRSRKSKRKGAVKKYFVTCATANAIVDKKFFAAIQNWCEEEGGELIVLLGAPHRGSGPRNEATYDKILNPLMDSGNATVEFSFNRHLKAIDAQINPQQIRPLTGLDHYGVSLSGGHTSVIFGHPVQARETQSSGNTTLPRLLLTTGAITRPTGYQYNRVGQLARDRHVLGGLIVEVDGNRFYPRHVQADKNGSFVSLGRKYSAKSKKSQVVRPLMMKLGDLHAEQTVELAWKTTLKMIQDLHPKEIRLEDLIDFEAISHHSAKNPFAKIRRPADCRDLEAVFEKAKKKLRDLINLRLKHNLDFEITITPSNHSPDHLIRYLREWRFIDDSSENLRYGIKLMNYLINHEIPEEKLIAAVIDPDGLCNWPAREESQRVEGFETNCHGDKGISGSRGNPSTLFKAFGPCLAAHNHGPGIYPGPVIIVGTLSPLVQDYAKGQGSRSLHTHGNIYEGGHYELIDIISGKYCLRGK